MKKAGCVRQKVLLVKKGKKGYDNSLKNLSQQLEKKGSTHQRDSGFKSSSLTKELKNCTSGEVALV